MKNQEKRKSVNESDKVLSTHEISKIRNKTSYKDTIRINYLEHKDLLSVMTILPDSSLGSWGWKENERKDFVKFIEKNNFTVDTTKNYNDIQEIKPNTIRIKVVDGVWILSIYKIKSNNYIVLTDDIVGDGNEIKPYEYENGKLRSIRFEELFGDFMIELLVDKNNLKSLESLDDRSVEFEYNFESETTVVLNNSWHLKEEKNSCFKGNTLAFNFNRTTKKFDLSKVTWTKYKQK